jgi:hypothetical protein
MDALQRSFPQLQGATMAKLKADLAAEDAYWRENFRDRSYIGVDDVYDDFGPAYVYGVQSFRRYDADGRDGRHFDEVESELSRDWEKFKGKSRLTWERAKAAVRDAWDHLTD